MTSGRYTAYHVYQGLSFPEAQKAGTRPYRLDEYQCPHSQRGALFQFSNMVERTHFDAATTTCCDEPVMNFGNKPQYAEASKPMTPKDCGARVTTVGCTILEVSVESAQSFCADSANKISRIKIQCPALCDDLAAIQNGGKISGTYGVMKSLGMEAGDIMILDYTPHEDLLADWQAHCSGQAALTEEFCGGYSLSFILLDGLDSDRGCSCDCCGSSGFFTPPSLSIEAPSGFVPDWGSELSTADIISGSEACSGGAIDGSFSGPVGSAPVAWAEDTKYSGGGGERFITRQLESIGSDDAPACCGGELTWTGFDGCGGSGMGYTTVSSKITDMEISSNANYAYFTEGDTGALFSGRDACSSSATADLELDMPCLTNSGADLQRYDGYVVRGVDGALQVKSSGDCNRCCAEAELTVSFHNGCGDDPVSQSYWVRQSFISGGTDHIGYEFRCSGQNMGGAWVWRIDRAPLYCDGTKGAFDGSLFPYFYTSTEECYDAMSGADKGLILGEKGCAGLSGGSGVSGCCWYGEWLDPNYVFSASVQSVRDDKCCQMLSVNTEWAVSGTGADCCPQE